MTSKNKLLLSFLAILVLAMSAAWIVYPKGSKISLKKLKINYVKEFSIKLGLDLQGGSHLVYQADFKDIKPEDRADALNAIRDVIERRVNSFGVAEPQVAVSGQDRIVIELPGIKNIDEAIEQIGQTPRLEFKTESQALQQAVPDKNGNVTIDANEAWQVTGLSGTQLKKASVDFNSGVGMGEPVVRLEFNEDGKNLFAEITQANVGKQVAIFLDGQMVSAPTVQTAITDGVAIVSGNFTVDQAKLMATRLNSGALPVPINLLSQQNVGATLGKESIQKSLLAGLIGLILIAIFMVSYYRLPGLLAVAALLIYALISIAVFKIGISFTAVALVGAFFLLGLTVNPWFGLMSLVSYILLMLVGALSPVTLTLAGIAGFILSIGMAVDANILIFERVKEEIRAGKNIEKSLDDGFQRAWLSIRDSNVSSLITTAILYYFGSPSIKGFSITLAIGILISMFTAITVTRTFLRLFLGSDMLRHPWLYGVSKLKNSK